MYVTSLCFPHTYVFASNLPLGIIYLHALCELHTLQYDHTDMAKEQGDAKKKEEKKDKEEIDVANLDWFDLADTVRPSPPSLSLLKFLLRRSKNLSESRNIKPSLPLPYCTALIHVCTGPAAFPDHPNPQGEAQGEWGQIQLIR